MILSPTDNASMVFFSPLLWYQGERVDTTFNIYNETTQVKGNSRDIAYSKSCAYEFYTEPLAHGCLVSRTLLGDSVRVDRDDKGKYGITQYKTRWSNIIDYGRMKGRYIPTFADPGTWTYVHHFELPEYLYDTEGMIDYYNDLQYDLAGSVDWPIIDRIMQWDKEKGKRNFLDLDDKTKEMRRNLTLELAEDFINKCSKRSNLQFVPFATIQGYSYDTYRESLRQVLKLYPPYIAIGGLPSYSEKRVVELLPMIWGEIRKKGYRPGLHLYGRFPSPEHVGTFLRYGVTSFDNNSGFIVASKNDCAVYHPRFRTEGDIPLQECYNINVSAITSPMLRKVKAKYGEDSKEYKKVFNATARAFKAFNKYCKNDTKQNAKKFMRLYKKADLVYNELSRARPWGQVRLQHSYDRMKRTLRDKPWEQCGCTSCRMLGPHIALRRGCRIQHTFFHNTYVQFARYIRELKTAEKNVYYPKYNWKPILEKNRLKNHRLAIRRKR